MDPETLEEILNRVLAVAEICLDEAGLDVPEQIFHHHGPRRPPADCCDYLSVFVRQIRPTLEGERGASFPATFNGVKNNCADLLMAVDASLAVVRPCFPSVKADKRNPWPGEDEMQAAADLLSSYARVLWCCLISAHVGGVLLPDQSYELAWGVMAPFRGGGCAGWQWDFTIMVPACCWDVPDFPASGS